MNDGGEKRRYSRVSPGVNFSAMVQHTNKEDREYYEGLIEDISLGVGVCY